jgi:hypothetical protein
MSDAVLNRPPIRFPTQREVAMALLNGWFLVLLGIAIGVMWTADNLKSTAYQYRAQMQVTQAQANGDTNQTALGSLASFASAGLPIAQNGSEFRLYLDSLKTRDIADELAKDPAIMHTLFASEWDEATQSWHEPGISKPDAYYKEIYDAIGFPSVPWHAPDSESLQQTLGNLISIDQDPRRPYVATVAVTYYDPQFAIKLLNDLHKTADNALRQKTIRRTTEYIAFLNNLLSRVTVVEHRTSIAQSLSEQEKTAMIAQSGSAYAAEPFERPWVGSFPVAPRPLPALAEGVFFGALGGSLLAVLMWGPGSRLKARLSRLALKRRLRRE